MLKTTPIIKYNLKERGRQFTGKDRNFNIQAMCDSINSPATQERVRKRDMVGFYGHWARKRFGMNPAEGGIAEGKVHSVEPALVTTLLKAYPDGTVEHQAEFLSGQPGQLAARLFNDKTGGFSSAIDTIAPQMYGFDYVLEPNYDTNRGYTFDSVNMTFDDVLAEEYDEHLRGLQLLSDSNHRILEAFDNCNTELERTRLENDILISQIANFELNPVDAGFRAMNITLDSASGLTRDIDSFANARLLFPQSVKPIKTDDSNAYEQIRQGLRY